MKILVTGDSWAAGDWNVPFGNTKFNPILKNLLQEDGNEVVFAPHPGESDLPALQSIKKYIEEVDFAIFFKTEISRLLVTKPSKQKYNLVKGQDWPDIDRLSYSNISSDIVNEMFYFGCIDFGKLLIDYFYKEQNLNNIFYKINHEKVYTELKKNSQKILIVGGIEKINTEYQFEYVIEDLVKYLTGYCNNNYTICSSVVLNELKNISNKINKLEISNTLLDEALTMHSNDKKLYNIFLSTPDFFGPQDKVHPNETAINLYYHKLIKPILEEIENDYRTTV